MEQIILGLVVLFLLYDKKYPIKYYSLILYNKAKMKFYLHFGKFYTVDKFDSFDYWVMYDSAGMMRTFQGIRPRNLTTGTITTSAPTASSSASTATAQASVAISASALNISPTFLNNGWITSSNGQSSNSAITPIINDLINDQLDELRIEISALEVTVSMLESKIKHLNKKE